MSRVSSFGHHSAMLQGLLDSQSRLYATQQQINTGKKTTEFRGMARETQTLLGAKSLLTRTQGYIATAREIGQRLDSTELQLETVHKAAEDLKLALTEAVGQGKVIAFDETLEQAASIIMNALNTNIGGVYLFAGSRTDVKPVSGSGLADLMAAASVADLFNNDQMRLSAKLNDNVELTYGVVASEVAQDLLTSIRNIADFHAGAAGPLEGNLDPAQRAFLTSEIPNLTAALDKVQTLIAENGLRQNRVEAVTEELDKSATFLEIFVSDIEDVNVAEAITRLNMDQMSLQASFSVISTLSRLSLVNFL